jgi:hypothetical protein
MTGYPQFDRTPEQVRRAGDALKDTILWHEDRSDEILEIFAIANGWRASHRYPMNRLRQELIGKMRSRELKGIPVARLKSMRSVRRKLARSNLRLDQIQDLGGCRAVLPSIAAVNDLIDAYRTSARHTFHKETDYIANPKRGGYRCFHLMYKFKGEGATAALDGRRIEVQIRTRLQHSWATAVEAVGLFRKEDMKGGQGDADWLRLFELMSAELALAENCPEGAGLPPRQQRVGELQKLNQKLGAIATLENLRHAVDYMAHYNIGMDSPRYFRLEYDNVTHKVTVTPSLRSITVMSDAEQKDNVSGENRITTVEIEADRVEDLYEGYPNYFGDVQLFTRNLKDITLGKAAREYVMPPQETVPPPPHEVPDLSWFRRHKRWQ